MKRLTLIVDGRCDQSIAIDRLRSLSCYQIFVICDSPSPPIYLVQIVSETEVFELLETVKTDFIGFASIAALDSISSISLPTQDHSFLAPWIPQVTLPIETATIASDSIQAWIASTELVQPVLQQLPIDRWTLLEIAAALEQENIEFRWRTAASRQKQKIDCPSKLTVLAIVPHYRCETWLRRCLRSLVNQTRLPDAIVVIDDASEVPPISIVEEFPSITLLASDRNVGPYRLIQQVIEETNYWAYLFQDADDWSSCDRLEKLIQAALETDAQLVGTQELRVFESGVFKLERMLPVCYPLAVNEALSVKPGHPLLHPTSLVTRDLVMRIGGFATGLRFSGDTEFLLRSTFIAKIANIPDFCYFRQHRSGSLTTDSTTGLESPARQELLRQIKQRSIANCAAVQAGQRPNLTPLIQSEPIHLKHLAGPQLQQQSSELLETQS